MGEWGELGTVKRLTRFKETEKLPNLKLIKTDFVWPGVNHIGHSPLKDLICCQGDEILPLGK